MRTPRVITLAALSGAAMLLCFLGCSDEDPVSTLTPAGPGIDGMEISESVIHGGQQPSPLVDIEWQSESMTCWPYTGQNFTGAPQDPINVIFVGNVDAVEIRAALMSLDGDRTGYIPPELQAIPVFNETWSDALGNAQTGYAEGDEWMGAVVQLQLGPYAPLRFHLRLLECSEPFGTDGRWTLANAHFDMLVGVTTEHQVISWELAEYIVAVDMVRSGLLDPASLPVPSQTDVINQEPSFREVPAPVYAGIPQWLKDLCGLSTPAIPNDGKAMILQVAGSVPVEPGTAFSSFSMPYAQIVPKPFCSAGPLDFISLDGYLDLTKTVVVDEFGGYEYSSIVSGHLLATPMDVLQNPPASSGPSFKAIVSDQQTGILNAELSRVTFDQKRLGPRKGGVDKLMVMLKVSSEAENLYKVRTQCTGE